MLYDSNIIAFPGLGLEFDMNPVAFTVFGRDIMWYGILIAAGILLGLALALRQAGKNGVSPDDLIDLVLWATPLSIAGARAYYILFNLERYKTFQDVISVWNGGIAIYGAILTGVVVVFVFTKAKRINRGMILDIGAFGLLVGQIVGRFGNFVNREAYGSPFSGLFRMEIFERAMNARVSVHPTFLYESAWNLLGLLLLLLYFKRRKFNGESFLLYAGWYGLGRGMIEGLRADSLYIAGTGIRVSQVLGFLSFAIVLVLLMSLYTKKRYQNLKVGIQFLNPLESPYRLPKEEPASKAFDGGEDAEDVSSYVSADASEDAFEEAHEPPEEQGAKEDPPEEPKEALEGEKEETTSGEDENEAKDAFAPSEDEDTILGRIERFIPHEDGEEKR